MGSRQYWVVVWRWGLVSTIVRFADTLPDYKNLPPAEKIQRDLNKGRVTKEILPYLLNNADLFFGALIVEGRSPSGTPPQFEPLPGFSGYGTLTVPDDYVMYAIDGQHRLKAIQEAIEVDPGFASESQSVILVWHETTTKTRKLFTHVNKHARATTAAANILLDDEDIFAEITRRLEQDCDPLTRRVNWKGNTLSKTTDNITTARVLRESARLWLDEYNIRDSLVEIPESTVDAYYEEVREIWDEILELVDVFVQAQSTALTVRQLREQSLLLRPAAQLAMIAGVQCARESGLDTRTIATRLNRIDWSPGNSLWNRIIYNADQDRMLTARENVQFMGQLLGYVLGAATTDEQKADLLRKLQGYQENARSLPAPIE